MITIIVPVFNAEKTIKRCIESIMNQQSVQTFELLLIDDGSTDGSRKICEKYLSDDRVRLLSKNNGGVSSARNLGLANATGDWILFVDSDDYLAPKTLHEYEKSILDTSIYYIQDYYIDMPNLQWKVEFSQKNKKVYTIRRGMEILMTRYHNSMGYIWHCLFSKQIIDKYNLKFSEQLSFGEDGIFAFQYLQYMDRARFIPYKGYHYCNINPSSLTKTVKMTPSQNYVLVSSIFLSIPRVPDKFNTYESLIIKKYLIRIFLKGLLSLNKVNEKDRESFCLQYNKLLSDYDFLYKNLNIGGGLEDFVYGNYSKELFTKLALYYNNMKLAKNEYYHRLMDKIYNMFIR